MRDVLLSYCLSKIQIDISCKLFSFSEKSKITILKCSLIFKFRRSIDEIISNYRNPIITKSYQPKKRPIRE